MNMQPDNFERDVDWSFELKDVGFLFKIPAAEGKQVKVFNNSTFLAKTTKTHHFDRDLLRCTLAFLFADNAGDGLMIYGPYGAGKTTFIREVLGRLKWPTLMLSWNETSDTADLIGKTGLSFGNTVFEPGPLTIAAKKGFALVINEIDRGRAGNLVALNDLLDGGKLVIKETGEVITPHPNFRLICTANSAGSGDLTGAYTGSVRKLDPAFLDRFAMLEVGYLDQQVEVDLMLRKFPEFQKVSGGFVEAMVSFAQETRAKATDIGEALNTAFSTRALERFFRNGMAMGLHRKVQPGSVDKEAVWSVLGMAYVNRLSAEEREVARTVFNLTFNG